MDDKADWKRVCVLFDPIQYRKVQKISKEYNRKISQVIRAFVDTEISKYENRKRPTDRSL